MYEPALAAMEIRQVSTRHVPRLAISGATELRFLPPNHNAGVCPTLLLLAFWPCLCPRSCARLCPRPLPRLYPSFVLPLPSPAASGASQLASSGSTALACTWPLGCHRRCRDSPMNPEHCVPSTGHEAPPPVSGLAEKVTKKLLIRRNLPKRLRKSNVLVMYVFFW